MVIKLLQTYLRFPKHCDTHRRHQNPENEFVSPLKAEDSALEKVAQENNKSEDCAEAAKRPSESLLGNSSPGSNAPPYTSNSSAFHDKYDGFHFCTESLGFESSDEREDCCTQSSVGSTETVSEQEDDFYSGEASQCTEIRRRYSHGHVGAKEGPRFPPPLSSMVRNGQPSVLLKPLRKDGRFLLQEVRGVPRHEFLHAWREDGRLRLHVIDPHPLPRPNNIDDDNASAATDGKSEDSAAADEAETAST